MVVGSVVTVVGLTTGIVGAGTALVTPPSQAADR